MFGLIKSHLKMIIILKFYTRRSPCCVGNDSQLTDLFWKDPSIGWMDGWVDAKATFAEKHCGNHMFSKYV